MSSIIGSRQKKAHVTLMRNPCLLLHRNMINKSIIVKGWVTDIQLFVACDFYNVHVSNPPFSYIFHSFVRLSP